MKLRIACIAALAGISVIASAAYAASTRDFVHTASIANEFEIESSKLALEKSHNADVRDFARRMVDDHTKTGIKLKEVLESSKSRARAAEGLDSKHQKLMDTLQDASGNDFNRKYIRMQTSAHKEAVALFSGYAKHGADPVLRKFAADTLPTLEDHLKHVKTLKQSD